MTAVSALASDRHARAALTALGGRSDARIAALADNHSPLEAVAAILDADPYGPLQPYRDRLIHEIDVDRDLEAAEQHGARLVCPYDPEWPAGLDDLARAGDIGGTHGPPLALWIRGEAQLALVTARSCAIVGSRAATEYGQYVASELGAGLADDEVTVVSGAAFGIDAAAHRGALAADGATVAVMACGVDVPYPRPHADLLDRIASEGGAIVSEYPFGTVPRRTYFLDRNRLIAALSGGLVIVEAGKNSGSMNAVGWAARCGRPVMGVPGPVTSGVASGVHALLRDGTAHVVVDSEDVIARIDGGKRSSEQSARAVCAHCGMPQPEREPGNPR